MIDLVAKVLIFPEVDKPAGVAPQKDVTPSLARESVT